MQINGKELKITPAGFQDALSLQKAIGRALRGNKLNLPESLSADMSMTEITGLIDAILSVAVSDEITDCLFACSSRAMLGNDKIDRDFFEKVENREHFYPIMIEVIKVNVGPFFKALISKFGGLGQVIASIQK